LQCNGLAACEELVSGSYFDPIIGGIGADKRLIALLLFPITGVAPSWLAVQ